MQDDDLSSHDTEWRSVHTSDSDVEIEHVVDEGEFKIGKGGVKDLQSDIHDEQVHLDRKRYSWRMLRGGSFGMFGPASSVGEVDGGLMVWYRNEVLMAGPHGHPKPPTDASSHEREKWLHRWERLERKRMGRPKYPCGLLDSSDDEYEDDEKAKFKQMYKRWNVMLDLCCKKMKTLKEDL